MMLTGRSCGIEPPSYMQTIVARAAHTAAALASPSAPAAAVAPDNARLGEARARAVCSYDARDASELALVVDDVVYAKKDATLPPGWMWGRIGARSGRVQSDYLDFDDDEDA